MSIFCVLFTLTLTFQVIHPHSVQDALFDLARLQITVVFLLPQTASPVIPYISMVCVFAFILSFGLGPGTETETLFRLIPSAAAAGLSCSSSFHAGGVTNILTTELFTQTARPAAYVIAGSVNWLNFFFIGLVFPFIVVGACGRSKVESMIFNDSVFV